MLVFTSTTPYPGCPEHSVGQGVAWLRRCVGHKNQNTALHAPRRNTRAGARDGEPRDAEREEYTFLC